MGSAREASPLLVAVILKLRVEVIDERPGSVVLEEYPHQLLVAVAVPTDHGIDVSGSLTVSRSKRWVPIKAKCIEPTNAFLRQGPPANSAPANSPKVNNPIIQGCVVGPADAGVAVFCMEFHEKSLPSNSNVVETTERKIETTSKQ